MSSRTAPFPPPRLVMNRAAILADEWAPGGSGRETSYLHGRNVIDVIAHVTDLRQVETREFREVLQRLALVFAASVDIGDPQPIDEPLQKRPVFPGDERESQTGAAPDGDPMMSRNETRLSSSPAGPQ